MKRRSRSSRLPRLASYFACTALALAGCVAGCGNSSGGGSNAPSAETKATLEYLSNSVVLPTYRTLDQDAGKLSEAATELQKTPSADALARTQAAWRAARKSWRKSDAFRFGPVESGYDKFGEIDYWPANGSKIDTLIQGTNPISAESFAALGADAKGFMALEYVLFDNAGGGDAGVLAKLTGDGAAERRRTFIAVAAAGLKIRTAELFRAWDPAGENFTEQVANAGNGSATFPSGKSAVDQFVNTATYAGDLVAGSKIAKPLGKKTGGVVQPGEEETPRSDNSLNDMLATLEGVQDVYAGTGISALVRAKNASLDGRVLAALSDARAKVAAVPPPFRTAITGQAAAVDASYESVRAMKNMFATDVASTLGTTLKFNDNDGD